LLSGTVILGCTLQSGRTWLLHDTAWVMNYQEMPMPCRLPPQMVDKMLVSWP